jgi:hypothetical protein
VFVSSPTTLRGVPLNPGCLRRFPPKSKRVPIIFSFNNFTKSFREIGALDFNVIANPNQEGSELGVACGNCRNSAHPARRDDKKAQSLK